MSASKVEMESGKLVRKVVIQVGRWCRREGEKRKGWWWKVEEGGRKEKRVVVEIVRKDGFKLEGGG